MMKRILLIALAIMLCASCASCGGKTVDNPIVTIEMENGGIITAELYPDKAPNTVANFVTLIQGGFYDGLTFHRGAPGFVIQGGCPDGTGMGSPGYRIKGEFANNKFTQNDLKHDRGVFSMARSGDPDSAGSQFFICVGDVASLDKGYAGFGKVLDEESMKVVDAIAAIPNSGGQEMRLATPPRIKKITVDTKGVEYKVTKIN